MDLRQLEIIKTALLLEGNRSSANLGAVSKLSIPQVTRYLKALGSSLLRVGKGKNTRYFLKREIPQSGSDIPLYQVNESGGIVEMGVLSPVFPRGIFFEGTHKGSSRYFNDLPYFLDDLRPSGFLGRLIPKLYPEWGFPTDIRLWSADASIRYLTRFGWDTVGNIILGEASAQKFMQNKHGLVSDLTEYPSLARLVESHGIPGSSAGGEHPKFLTRRSADKAAVLVKFVHRSEGEHIQRRIDLLRAEHSALTLLCERHNASCMSRILEKDNYVFLEVTRFDRIGATGRKGVLSLRALDAEFVGSGERWSKVARSLAVQGIITEIEEKEILFLELFGQFIGNTDMHSGNLSFFVGDDFLIKGVTPSYDMLPMRYAPYQGSVYSGRIDDVVPSPRTISLLNEARPLAIRFWKSLVQDAEFSEEFREIARKNVDALSA